MKLSLIAAKSKNNVIGAGLDIPWQVKGEQLLFKAMTFNQWILVGRKTFESMGVLPNRRYAVISRSFDFSSRTDILLFPSIKDALAELPNHTDHVFVSGGGQIYQHLISQSDFLHISTIQRHVEGDVIFPEIPSVFEKCFRQKFKSNINYTYEIWRRKQP